MGYACPVCDAPQRDETHLANHLALQAIVHGDAHEDWLSEHAPSWASMNPGSLGPVVADLAEERDFDEVFDDTVDRGHERGGDHPHGRDHPRDTRRGSVGGDGAALSGETARIVEEARELTREMYADADDDADEKES